jgi:MFS family permease
MSPVEKAQKNKTWLIKALVFIMLPLAGSGIDIYSPALPFLKHYLATTETMVKLTISLYLLGLCVGQLFFGTASDCSGRKVTSLFGGVGFVLASVGILFTHDPHVFLLARLLQGFFLGAIAVNARSLVTDHFTKQEISGISSYMSLAWSMGPILAPFLGGVFQTVLSWQWSFGFLIVYTVLILVLMSRIEESLPQRKSFDGRTMLKNYKHVLSHRGFVEAFLIMAVGYSLLMCYAVILPFFVQNILGKSSFFYGNTATLIGLSYFCGSLINRMLQKFFAVKFIINGALAVMSGLCVVMFVMNVSLHTNLIALYLPILLLTVCIAVIFPSCLAKCISLFPQMAGVASSVAGAGFIFVGSVSTMVLSHFHFDTAWKVVSAFSVLVFCAVVLRCFFQCINHEAEVTTAAS